MSISDSERKAAEDKPLTREGVKHDVIAIIQRHLDSITEARKDTTGLGMIQHIIKMILAEVREL